MKRRVWGILAAALLGCAGCARHFLEEGEEAVVIYLRAPEAREVRLVVSAEAVEDIPAEPAGFGLWRARREGRGEFRYSFRVDGKIEPPDCLMRERDDFGSWNCVFDPRAVRRR